MLIYSNRCEPIPICSMSNFNRKSMYGFWSKKNFNCKKLIQLPLKCNHPQQNKLQKGRINKKAIKGQFQFQIIQSTNQMSQDEIHHDSLLSSISNISVKIDHTQIDDPGFFMQNVIKSRDEQEIEGEVDIDVLEDDEDIDPASLVKQIYFRYRAQQGGSEKEDGVERWVAKNEGEGMSEEENAENTELASQQQNSIPNQQLKFQQPHNQNSPSSPPLTQLLLHQRLQQQQKRLKNQTKNIPKNYGKAIITFVEKYQQKVRSILQKDHISYEQFLEDLKQKKRVINTIADLRSMWLDYKHARSMRVLSNLFLRKYSLSYIFNSRICNYTSHIKYRYRLCQAIREPFLFKHIKDY